METTSIGNIYGGYVPKATMRIYVIKDSGGQVLYVGRSKDAVERVRGHMGIGSYVFGGSRIGTHIVKCWPAAQAWPVELYDVHDCASIYPYPYKLNGTPLDNIIRDMHVEHAEEELIQYLQPPYNVLGKGYD